jgi:molybdate transport repressor ModE-like protein
MLPRHNRIVNRVISRLKLRQLRLLVTVAQYGSIQHAARELQISQPAATKLIQDLENDFEVNLFERTNRGVIPTAFGDALVRHAKLMLVQVSNATQELDDLAEGSSGRVVVGALLAAAPQLLPSAIELLLKERPHVAVKIIEGTNDALMPALLAGEMDLIVGRLPAYRAPTKLVQEKLFDERIVAIAGHQHPLSGKKKLGFEQLKPYSWVLPPQETTLRRQADQFFVRQDQYLPTVVLESVSYLTIRSLLQTHDLLGFMPEHVISHDVNNKLLAVIDWAVPFGKGPVGISHRGPESLSPAAAEFVKSLHKVAKTMRSTGV